ncbi:MAG: 3-phosphoshikimate 1-carboxyvinyltransferase [Roseburia sp.]|jgi:3-phosphoshikimate 1-carboxyvinyltransferase|nr:3-phosphoshikimate 1-carboxyvinyltransferase [Roseburia sp.]
MENRYLVKTVNQPVDWKVTVPGSKSMTNRALLLAALSEGTVEVEGVLFSDDSRHFLGSLDALGFALRVDEERKHVTVTGCGGKIPRKEAQIDVGSAGTAARFLTAMLGVSDGCYTILASEQMKRRPMLPLFEGLMSVGARITYLEKEGFLPVKICGRGYRGEEEAGPAKGTPGTAGEEAGPALPAELALDISKSTQFLSAMLLVAPMIRQGLFVRITSEKTDGSYIRITRTMMEEFGVTAEFDGRNYTVAPGVSYRRERCTVEPDMSAACYFYAAAAVTGGRAVVNHVHRDNTQGDLKFLEVLARMGCTVEETADGICVTGPRDGKLHGITVDMNDFSDQALTLAAIAPFADAPVQIRHIGHIRLQESDRIRAITEALGALGIRCEEEEDAVRILPKEPHGGTVKTYEDHRVAMAFALTGLRTDGVWIENPACCGKTFEEYFDVLEELTGGASAGRKCQ